MADFKLFFNRLLQEEGGYSDDPADPGGPTKYGVTLAEWIKQGYDKNGDGKIDAEDVKLLDTNDAYKIAKEDYWDPVAGDMINSQDVADVVFDWGYNSGTKTAIKYLQRTLGFMNGDVDGIIGTKTIQATNSTDPKQLFDTLKQNREAFYRAIVTKDPSRQKFLKGWLIRNNSFVYGQI